MFPTLASCDNKLEIGWCLNRGFCEALFESISDSVLISVSIFKWGRIMVELHSIVVLLCQIERLNAKYQHLKPKSKEAEAKSSVPECVEVKVRELQSEMTRLAQAQEFTEAGVVKKRVRLRLDLFYCVAFDFFIQ